MMKFKQVSPTPAAQDPRCKIDQAGPLGAGVIHREPTLGSILQPKSPSQKPPTKPGWTEYFWHNALDFFWKRGQKMVKPSVLG